MQCVVSCRPRSHLMNAMLRSLIDQCMFCDWDVWIHLKIVKFSLIRQRYV